MRAAALIAALLSGCTTRQTATVVTPLDDAERLYPDLRTLWSRSVSPTCSPNQGVCHNDRQFPDLQTVSGLLATVNARCNQLRDDPTTIDNLCEPVGDRFQIGAFSSRIGTVSATPASGPPTSLTLTLHDPIPSASRGAPAIVRQSPGLPKVVLPIPRGALAPISPGARAVTLSWPALSSAQLGAAPGQTLAQFLLPPRFVPGDSTQIELGDPNRDGVFGADLGGALVAPGAPRESYLLLRVLAPLAIGGGEQLTNRAAPASTEAQMPIANTDHWDRFNDTIALWCWIAGLRADGSNADGPIDYASCDWTDVPTSGSPGEDATTFTAIYSQILQPACSGCHHSGGAAGGSLILDDLDGSYATLLGTRGTGPSETTTPFVTAGDPARSYLYLKVAGDASIAGARMPLGGALPQAQLDALRGWITQGANND